MSTHQHIMFLLRGAKERRVSGKTPSNNMSLKVSVPWRWISELGKTKLGTLCFPFKRMLNTSERQLPNTTELQWWRCASVTRKPWCIHPEGSSLINRGGAGSPAADGGGGTGTQVGTSEGRGPCEAGRRGQEQLERGTGWEVGVKELHRQIVRAFYAMLSSLEFIQVIKAGE